MTSAIIYFGTTSSLRKSTEIQCSSGLVRAACEAIEARNKLIEEL